MKGYSIISFLLQHTLDDFIFIGHIIHRITQRYPMNMKSIDDSPMPPRNNRHSGE